MSTKKRSKAVRSAKKEESLSKTAGEYYNRNGIIVRDSKRSDVDYLKYHLRRSDLLEIWRSHRYSPEEALNEAFEKSIMCFTIQNGNPIGMFGVNSQSLLSEKGIIWFLASYDLDRIKIRFLRHCRYFIDMMLERYPYLENYIDVDNKKTIQWLKFLGAEIHEAKPYGIQGEDFYYFVFRRKE